MKKYLVEVDDTAKTNTEDILRSLQDVFCCKVRCIGDCGSCPHIKVTEVQESEGK